MDEYKEKWEKCMEIIRTKMGKEDAGWSPDTWLGGLRFESYNPTTKQLVVQSQSKYVCEFWDMPRPLKLLSDTLHEVFDKKVRLGYRVMPEASLAAVAAYLERNKANSQRNPKLIHFDNARKLFQDGMERYLNGKPMQWLRGYDRVVDWLTDNKEKGLILFGTTGLGKSLICQQVIPLILAGGSPIAIASAKELHDRLDELKRARIVVLDDLGKEKRKHYGEVDTSFLELCENAYHTGALLLITTNLCTVPKPEDYTGYYPYADNIQTRYGDEVISRLKAITKSVCIEGEDLRK